MTISIIAILASLVLFAMFNAQQTAKDAKTRSMITRINNVVMPMYEGFRTMRVPISTAGLDAGPAAKYRLDALRELMRMELPDRWSDVTDDPVNASLAIPAACSAYRYRRQRIITDKGGAPTDEHQGAECLFLIVSMSEEGMEFFREGDIGDIDDDGAREFLDGWGRPIYFLRWPAGFSSVLQNQISDGTVAVASGTDVMNGTDTEWTPAVVGRSVYVEGEVKPFVIKAFTSPTRVTLSRAPVSNRGPGYLIVDPDPFDPRRVYPQVGQTQSTFAMWPLIYSAGPDGVTDIKADFATPLRYGTAARNNNPFVVDGDGLRIGAPVDVDGDGRDWLDNVHSHYIGRRA